MRHARPSKQCCWLGSSRYPCCRRVAFTNSNSVTNTYTDPNGNCYGHGHAQCYTNSHSNGYGQTNTHCTAERNTEAATYTAAAPLRKR